METKTMNVIESNEWEWELTPKEIDIYGRELARCWSEQQRIFSQCQHRQNCGKWCPYYKYRRIIKKRLDERQQILVEQAAGKYYMPPYEGVKDTLLSIVEWALFIPLCVVMIVGFPIGLLKGWYWLLCYLSEH